MPVDREYFLNGAVILIDKDYRWTSFDVVKKIRNTIGIKKVGHAGTLDPLATGLLIVCTGKKTKEIQNFQNLEKEYTGHFYLGATRRSHDKETEIDERSSIEGLTIEKIFNIADAFLGKIKQKPPSFSAIRQGGKRLYEFARQGEKVRVDSREVEVFKFEITDINLPRVSFLLRCSKGFYVRSLARDFGKALGCGAYLDSLRRTSIGTYTIEQANTIQEFVQKMNESNLGMNIKNE
jgi:tRNA pseudouridine55 synthase